MLDPSSLENGPLVHAFGELAVAVGAYRTQLGRAQHLGPTELNAMGHLVTDGPQTPTALAHRLRITPASVSALVDRLTVAGYVTRRAHPHDRRRQLVALTDPGRAAISVAYTAFAHRLNPIYAAFDPAEQHVILRFLAAASHAFTTSTNTIHEQSDSAANDDPAEPAPAVLPDRPPQIHPQQGPS